MSQRVLTLTLAVVLGGVASWALAQQSQPEQKKAEGGHGRFAVVVSGDTAVLLDTAGGKTWILRQAGNGGAVWLPVHRLDSEKEAREWLERERAQKAALQDQERALAAGRWGNPPGERASGTDKQPAGPAEPVPEPKHHDFGLKVELVGSASGESGERLLAEGQKLEFRIAVERDAYVGVWNIGPDGVIQQIFPNDYESDHLVRAGKPRTVPGGAAAEEYELHAAYSGGTERVWAVASTERWKPPGGERAGPYPIFRTKEQKRAILLVPTAKIARVAVAEQVLPYRVQRSGPASSPPLHAAARAGDVALIKMLLTKGAAVNEQDGLGRTALWVAVSQGKRDAAEALLIGGANVNGGDGQRLPLHLAVSRGEAKMVALLILKGANVNAKDADGNTPLGLAKAKGHEDIMAILKRSGASDR